MNSQPANTHPNSYSDALIDQVLNALRTAEAPAGLEQRVAARLAETAHARTHSAAAPSFFAGLLNSVKDARTSLAPAQLSAAAALALLVALSTLTILHNHVSTTTQSQSIPFRATEQTRTSSPAQIAANNPPIPRASSLATTSSSANQIPRGFSLGSHSLSNGAGVLTPASSQDPDTIALAETRAPSLTAPPRPLTQQEHLILAATRPGQPIQLAELDLARAPHLRAAAQAREDASIERYVKSLLAPFALADALSSTTSSQPQENSSPTPAPQPTDSPSN